MLAYHDMIDEVLTFGTRKENRTGVDTLSTFNHNYELCWDRALYGSKGKGYYPVGTHVIDSGDSPGSYRVPLLTTKKINWRNIVVEMLWFLSGSTDISLLQRHGCTFWDHWADERGQVPSAYGSFWVNFPVHGWDIPSVPKGSSEKPTRVALFNNQIAWVLKELRNNPMSRRMVVSAWAPDNAQTSKLPPCHFAFALNVQLTPSGEQRLCLHLTQRSCDLALGVPYNMASYGLLLLIFSHLSGIKPGIFAHTLLDLHAYTAKPDGSKAEYDHVPGLKKQRNRSHRVLPTVTIDPAIKELSDIEALMGQDVPTEEVLAAFKLEGYDPSSFIPFKVAV